MTDLDARIDALHLEPGDILAIRAHRRITSEQASQLQDMAKAVVGDDHPVLILAPDFELMVVRYPLTPSDPPAITRSTTDEGT